MLSPSVLDLDDLYLVWYVQNVNPNETVLFYEVSFVLFLDLTAIKNVQHPARHESRVGRITEEEERTIRKILILNCV